MTRKKVVRRSRGDRLTNANDVLNATGKENKTPSSQVSRLFDDLPPSEQRALLRKHILPLLNCVDNETSSKILSAATHASNRVSKMPKLDFDRKKGEFIALQSELEREDRYGPRGDRSARTEILNEMVRSLVAWVSDIWIVGCEYKTEFGLVHTCLLFCLLFVDDIMRTRQGCQCTFGSMLIDVRIKNQAGNTMRHFRFTGAHNIDQILFWIWRDFFLTILTYGDTRVKKEVPDMLNEIVKVTNWTVLNQIVEGGQPELLDQDDNHFSEGESWSTVKSDSECGDDGHYEYYPRNPRYWTPRMRAQLAPFRKILAQVLVKIFPMIPSHTFYSAIFAISNYNPVIEAEMRRELLTMAETSPDAFSTALLVHGESGNFKTVASLLESSSYLLRPRDFPALQATVIVLAAQPDHLPRALDILEKELMSCVVAMEAAAKTDFSKFANPLLADELIVILQLKSGTQVRAARVESWVDQASTEEDGGFNPMAFAAAFMGMPLPDVPPMDDIPLGLDMIGNPEHDDAEMAMIRDQYRPRLKARFESWVEAGNTIKNGSPVLLKVLRSIIKRMPFLRGQDVVQEMLSRISNRPSKSHQYDSLECLFKFVKNQTKVLAALKKAATAKAQKAGSSQTTPPAPAQAASSSSTSAAPTPTPVSVSVPDPPISASSTTVPHTILPEVSSEPPTTHASSSNEPAHPQQPFALPTLDAHALGSAPLAGEGQPRSGHEIYEEHTRRLAEERTRRMLTGFSDNFYRQIVGHAPADEESEESEASSGPVAGPSTTRLSGSNSAGTASSRSSRPSTSLTNQEPALGERSAPRQTVPPTPPPASHLPVFGPPLPSEVLQERERRNQPPPQIPSESQLEESESAMPGFWGELSTRFESQVLSEPPVVDAADMD